MTSLAERLVPDELWELFRRVVPPTEVTRPQGGGRRRAGDREVLTAIVFVATSGCSWRQLPPVFGPAWPTVYRRFAQWSKARVWARLHRVILDELGAQGELDWSRCAIDSVTSAPSKGAANGTESDRPRQERIENPPARRQVGPADLRRRLRREHARQPRPAASRAGHTARPWSARTAASPTTQAARRQALRLRPPAAMAPRTWHHTPHRPPRQVKLRTAGPTPVGRRTHHVLARRMPTSPPPLRSQTRTLPSLHRHRHQPDQLPQTHQLKRRLSRLFPTPNPSSCGRDRAPAAEEGRCRKALVFPLLLCLCCAVSELRVRLCRHRSRHGTDHRLLELLTATPGFLVRSYSDPKIRDSVSFLP